MRNETMVFMMKKWAKDPIKFFTECLDVKKEHVWEKMEEISCSVRDNQFTCVKAGNSLSKSYTVARIALWFLYTHYPATVVTTAPSNIQVEEILWREINAAHSNAKIPLGGEPTKTALDLQTWSKKKGIKGIEKWNAIGFATKPDQAEQHATRFQGFHNHNVLIIMDEAAGIHKKIWEAVDKLLTTSSQKMCVIGNPTMSKGDFVDCFKDARFNKITVSVYDSPNYKAGEEIIPGLSGRPFVEFVKTKYGEHSNYFKAMVTGEIPDEDVDSLIPISWIERAEGRVVEHPFKFDKRYVVWDVADGGDDLNVVKAFENTTEVDSVEVRGKKVEEIEPYVWRLLRKVDGNAIVVDADGIGRVAVGLLEQSKSKDVKIIPFEGSSREVNEKDVFYNRRHEAHWKMREMFEQNLLSISAIPDQREELASIKLVDHSKGFIAVEKKKDLKERLGRSPDRSDAIMMMCGCFDEVPIIKKRDSRYPLKRRDADYPFNPATV
jgi:phage terminase large subunit